MSHLERVEGPVCGVFAAALVSGKRFDEVYPVAREVRSLRRRVTNWRGHLYLLEIKHLLHRLGVRYKDCEGFRGGTLRQVQEIANPDNQYVVFVTGHYCTLHHGLVFDQLHPKGVTLADSDLGRRRRVIAVLKIL